MKKTTISFVLALLATAHLMQAAGQSFTAYIKPADYLATTFPGLNNKMNIVFPGGVVEPINISGTTQVTLIDGMEYILELSLLNYNFRANKKTPIIVINDLNPDPAAGGGHILTVSFKKS